IGILAESAGSVMIPRVSRLQSLGRSREIVEVTARMVCKLAAVYLPIYGFLVLFGREFIRLLFTDQYLPSWPVFAVNITLIPLGIVFSAYDPVMRAFAEYRYFLLRLRVGLMALLAAALWFGTRPLGQVGVIAIVVGVVAIERCATATKAARALGVTRAEIPL